MIIDNKPARWYEGQPFNQPGFRTNALDLNAEKIGSAQIFACLRDNGNAAGAPIGVPQMEPATVEARVGDLVTFDLTWTVPEPRVWRDLDHVEIRIGNEDETALVARFDEAAGRLSMLDGATGELIGGVVPGEAGTLETDTVILDVAGSMMRGSGPTGPSVTLTLAVAFKPEAAGRGYRVDIRAVDDTGAEQSETGVGAVYIAALSPTPVE